jgi:hypothetical protein
MSVWLKEWRAAFIKLTPLFFLLLAGSWTAAAIQAQSETDSGYPAPPTEQPPENDDPWADEPYPGPTPFTLIPIETPENQFQEGVTNGNSGASNPGFFQDQEIQPANGNLPSVGSESVSNGQPNVAGGQTAARDGMSQALLWLTFIAALLIFIAASFWSIMLFNRHTTAGR